MSTRAPTTSAIEIQTEPPITPVTNHSTDSGPTAEGDD